MFSGDISFWGAQEYAIIFAASVIVVLILRRLLRKKPLVPTTPPCEKCGTYTHVSLCQYCKKFYCQTHIFRKTHHCQDWREAQDKYAKKAADERIYV